MMEDMVEELERVKQEKDNRSGWRNAWDVFTTVLTLALVATAIYICINVANQSKTGELFFPFGYRPVVILSGSMEDTLETGAVVVVKQTKDVQENDIVFFIADGRTLVIHRCIGKNEDGTLITKGDNNPKEDLEPVTAEMVQGKVVMIMNWMAGPMDWAASITNGVARLFK